MRHNGCLSAACLPRVCPGHGCVPRTSSAPGIAGVPQRATHRSLSTEHCRTPSLVPSACCRVGGPSCLPGGTQRGSRYSLGTGDPPGERTDAHTSHPFREKPRQSLPPSLLSSLFYEVGLARQIFVLGKSKHSCGGLVAEEQRPSREAKVSRPALRFSTGTARPRALLDAGPRAPGLAAL